MSHSIDHATTGRNRLKSVLPFISWIALFIAILYFSLRGPIFPSGQRLWDYAVCASSSYLWVHGQNPFEWDAVKASWIERGSAPGIEDDIGWLYAIVPPTTLAVLAPFAAMPVAIGAYLYLVSTSALLGVSAWLSGKWAGLKGAAAWRFFAAALLVSVPATLGLYAGNPTMLAAPLLLIGSYLLAHRQSVRIDIFAGLMIGVGVACKLQLGVPILVFWLVWGRWRAAGAAFITVVAIAIIAIGRLEAADIDWWTQWSTNVRATNSAGGLNDYVAAKNPDDLVNLQVALFRAFGDRFWTDLTTYLIWGSLSLAVLVGIVRQRERDAMATLTCLNAVCLLILMPVYHRTYDATLLIPLLASSVAALAWQRSWWGSWAQILLLSSLAVPAGLPAFLVRRLPSWSLDQSDLFNLVAVPHKSWCLLFLTFFVVWRYLTFSGTVSAGRASGVQEKS